MHCGYYKLKDKIYFNRQNLVDDLMIEYEIYKNTKDVPRPDFGPQSNVLDFLDHVKQYSGGLPQIEYEFNSDVFNKIDWSIEPEVSLKQLYVERAKQLRDKYDYLILSYSGGSDSHEILLTFLENNIFIDEIQTIHYHKAINQIGIDRILSDKAAAALAEYELVCVPWLKKVKELSPNTKINTIDISDDVMTDIEKNRFSFMGMHDKKAQAPFITQTTPHARNFFQHHHNNLHLTKTNNTAFIRGVEKPNLKVLNDKVLVFNFNDTALHGDKLIREKEIDPIYTIENFFWSRDCPLIPIKQSHILKKVVETDSQFYIDFMAYNSNKTIESYDNKRIKSPHQNFQRKYNSYIYYYWRNDMFVAPKHLTESAEFNLYSMIHKNNDNCYDALNEQNSYFLERYKNIKNFSLLNKQIASKQYVIGELNVSWI